MIKHIRLGVHQTSILTFYKDVGAGKWHSFNTKDRATAKAIKQLEQYGLLEVSEKYPHQATLTHLGRLIEPGYNVRIPGSFAWYTYDPEYLKAAISYAKDLVSNLGYEVYIFCWPEVARNNGAYSA
jgi:hypothetical protein